MLLYCNIVYLFTKLGTAGAYILSSHIAAYSKFTLIQLVRLQEIKDYRELVLIKS
jgi:hypothetical protein